MSDSSEYDTRRRYSFRSFSGSFELNAVASFHIHSLLASDEYSKLSDILCQAFYIFVLFFVFIGKYVLFGIDAVEV